MGMKAPSTPKPLQNSKQKNKQKVVVVSEEQIKSKKKQLEDKLKVMNFGKILQQFQKQLQLQFQYTIIIQYEIIRVNLKLKKNQLPLKIQNKQNLILLCRSFNKLNSKTPPNQIWKIDTNKRQIELSKFTSLNKRQFLKMLKNQQLIIQQIKNLFKGLMTSMRKQHLYKILQLLNPNKKIDNRISTQQTDTNLSSALIMQKIRKMYFFNNHNFQFMNDPNLNNKIKKLHCYDDQVIQISSLKKQTDGILQKWFIKPLYKYDQNKPILFDLKRDTISTFIKNLTHAIMKSRNPNQKLQLYQQIIILNESQIEWELFAQTDSSKIYKAKVQYQYVKSEEKQKITKLLIRKQYKEQYNQKLQNEKSVLKIISEQSHAHITKCYFSVQENQTIYLFQDCYPYKSLNIYKKLYSLTTSLFTKIFIVCQIIQALRFLEDNQIYHFDIKPDNVVIAKGIVSKLIDFGESFSKHVRKKKSNEFGYTLPYCAPERFSKNIEFHSKMDVFSLGMLMFQFFFDFLPVDFTKLSETKYITLLQEYSYINKFFFIPEMINQYGEHSFLYELMRIILKCISVNPEQRPTFQWLLLSLRQFLNYMDKIY